MDSRPKPLVLCILDGWGLAPAWGGNAISIADTKFMDKLWRDYPHTSIQASGTAVGLMEGVMGNSEVGHLTIGAGKIIFQPFMQVDAAIKNGQFFHNAALLGAVTHAQNNNSALHLIGLVSDGGVHAHIDHFLAMLDLCKQQGFTRVFIHAFTDGRDTKPMAAINFINKVAEKITAVGLGAIATVSGRYYAMDRNNHWDRTEQTYNALVKGIGETAESAQQAISNSYVDGKMDEFIVPTVVLNGGVPVATIKDNDAVVFMNYRPDRARQLTQFFLDPEKNRQLLSNLNFVTMSDYEMKLPYTAAFPPDVVVMPLGKILSERGLKQLRIAETEKYAHITYFLNGMKEEPFPLEDHLLIPSPKVPTYDKAPRMSADKIGKEVLKRLSKYDVIFINFANADMVGHTGDIQVTKDAVEAVDQNVGLIANEVLKIGGVMIITADHGNAEQKINPVTGSASTEHTNNPVPFIVVANPPYQLRDSFEETIQGVKFLTGSLADIAPTVLNILDIPQPPEMTATSLVKKRLKP